MRMTRTTVDVDTRALNAAQLQLKTKGLSATVNAALRSVARRPTLAAFDVTRDIDGSSSDVEMGRRERFADHEH